MRISRKELLCTILMQNTLKLFRITSTLTPPAHFMKHLCRRKLLSLSRGLSFILLRKKGNLLNIAEIELSALSRQCLNRRIGDMKTLAKEVATLEKERNRSKATILMAVR